MNYIVFAHVQDVYFDDESAEVVISSLRLGDDQDG
jgi:serine/threonine-protein phosphatase 6 regulatory subunit 3